MKRFMKLFIRRAISYIMYFFPINKRKIVLNDFYGKFYAGNPRAISEELQKRGNNDLEIVWLIRDLDIKFPSGIRSVQYNSIRAFYELATAKVIIQSGRGLRCHKKKGQIYLQTWHGPSAFKNVEKQVESQLSKEYVIDAKYDGYATDGIIADSDAQAKLFKESFWLNPKTEILRFGLPRNDGLIKKANNDCTKRACRQALGCSDNDYLVLYAPTFRKENSRDSYITDFKRLARSFKCVTDKNIKILVRLHPKIAAECEAFLKNDKWVLNASSYPDVQELAIACDAIISDYSSIFNDFLILRKPVFLYTSDIDNYTKNDRGLAKAFFQLPVTRAESMDELCDAVENFSLKKYQHGLNVFLASHPSYDDGKAAKKTVDWILKKMGEMEDR